jgi:hypothetical protein
VDRAHPVECIERYEIDRWLRPWIRLSSVPAIERPAAVPAGSGIGRSITMRALNWISSSWDDGLPVGTRRDLAQGHSPLTATRLRHPSWE